MKRQVTQLTMVLSVLAFAGVAQAAEKENIALAENLLEVMGVRETMESSFEMMKQIMPSQIQQMTSLDDVSAERMQSSMEKSIELVAQEMTWDNLKDEFALIYAETFSADELKGLVIFYEGPIGRKFVAKQPELLRRSMEISQERMMMLLPKISKLLEELAAEGADLSTDNQ